MSAGQTLFSMPHQDVVIKSSSSLRISYTAFRHTMAPKGMETYTSTSPGYEKGLSLSFISNFLSTYLVWHDPLKLQALRSIRPTVLLVPCLLTKPSGPFPLFPTSLRRADLPSERSDSRFEVAFIMMGIHGLFLFLLSAFSIQSLNCVLHIYIPIPILS